MLNFFLSKLKAFYFSHDRYFTYENTYCPQEQRSYGVATM